MTSVALRMTHSVKLHAPETEALSRYTLQCYFKLGGQGYTMAFATKWIGMPENLCPGLITRFVGAC
jgi:hypothetical protein